MVYKDMTLHTIAGFYAEYFSVCPNTTSKLHSIAVLKSVVKQNND